MGKLDISHGEEKGDGKGKTDYNPATSVKAGGKELLESAKFQDDIAKSLESQLESASSLAENQDLLNKGQLESSDVGKQITDSL